MADDETTKGDCGRIEEGMVNGPNGPRAADPWEMPHRRTAVKNGPRVTDAMVSVLGTATNLLVAIYRAKLSRDPAKLSAAIDDACEYIAECDDGSISEGIEYAAAEQSPVNPPEVNRLNRLLAAVVRDLEAIVCTEGDDAGVVLLSNDGPTHYDAEQKCQVYDHAYFSPLGDALMGIWNRIKDATPHGS